MVSLNWDQVNAWRLAAHSLLKRAGRDQIVDVVKHIGGLHAQVMSAAELQLWARVEGISPADVQRVLWTDRALIKTWAMRGTLHLVAASDFPLYVAALDKGVSPFYRRPSWLKYHGVTREEMDDLIEGVRSALTGTGMTREQLSKAMVDHTGKAHLGELLTSGWGALLKPVAHRGYLCFGPNQGQNVTFVKPDQWIGRWHPVDGEDALKEIARRYLSAYGPGTIDDFSRWLGMDESATKKVFRALGTELVEVDVEGWKAWALASTLPDMDRFKAKRTVRLLPYFDPYTVAVYRHAHYLLPEQFKDRVYRSQGWISPVVLVDGRMVGVWEYDKRRSATTVQVDMFVTLTDEVRAGIEREANRLASFLESQVQLSIH